MKKIAVQFQRFLIRKTKQLAIQTLTTYVNANLSDFEDGEEIVLRYLDNDGNIVSSNVIVEKINNSATLSIALSDVDTLKIVESDTEPADKDVIWLSNSGEDETGTGVVNQVKRLTKEIERLQQIVEKHDYALSSTIAGGDIITNSEKYERENENEGEKPEDAIDYTEYAEDDIVVNTFDIYLGPVPFETYYEATKLYKGQIYYLKFKFFNVKGEEINPDDISGTTSITSSDIEVADFKEGTTILKATKKGGVSIVAKVELYEGRVLSKKYDLYFNLNEEPYYERFEEPNVHHMLIKTAETYDILSASTSYLCVPEFVWCVGNNTLYLKAKASNGSINIFKISGSGGSITGDTEPTTSVTISYNINEDGILEMSGETITIDDDGILSLSGVTLDEDGILNFIGATGSTEPSEDEEETDISIEYDESTGYVSISGPNITLDEQGMLVIPEEFVNN